MKNGKIPMNDFYINLNKKISSNSAMCELLNVANKSITIYVYCMFSAVMIYLLFAQRFHEHVVITIFCALGFFLVTFIRNFISRTRPFAKYGFEPIVKCKKQNRSMPSRHTYSVFVIAIATLLIHPALFAFNLFCGIVLALTRILSGVHYISDILAGIAFAIVFGMLCIVV